MKARNGLSDENGPAHEEAQERHSLGFQAIQRFPAAG